jgi:citrate lyase subunit alpha/citrate CoA-transferase
LTVIFLPLATGKDGKGFPKVVEKVYTRTTPGEVIDVIVTEEFVTVNPKSRSTYKDAILARAKEFGVNLVTIEELHQKSLEKAAGFGVTPPLPELTDEVLDMIRKPVK